MPRYYVQGTMMEFIASRTVDASSRAEAIDKAKKAWIAEGRDITGFYWWAETGEQMNALAKRFNHHRDMLDKPPYWSGGYRYYV